LIIRPRRHGRQIRLFLLAVIFPSLILITFALRMIEQDRELAQKRAVEECRRRASGIGRQLLISLENLMMREVNAVASDDAAFSSRDYRHPAVILVGRLDGGRLLLPWECDPRLTRAGDCLGRDDFVRKMRQVEKAEYAGGNYSEAVRLLRRSLRSTDEKIQQSYIRMLLARVLLKAGRRDEALAQGILLLNSPPGLVDEYGIPLGLYTAEALLKSPDGPREIVAGLRRELDARSWLTPAAAYRIRRLIDATAELTPVDPLMESIREVRSRLDDYLRIMQASLRLQADFPGLGLARPTLGPPENQEPVWIAYGPDPWLIGCSPVPAGRLPLLMAVSGSRILDEVRDRMEMEGGTAAGPRFITGLTVPGESPGPNFRGLKIAFAPGYREALADQGNGRRFLYFSIVLLVSGVTLFGGYLLWRDIRREVDMAEMRSHFVSSVSHELKTPLTSIRMFAETLRLGRVRDRKSREEYLGTIVNESQRLTRLLNNVLDFSKIEQGKRLYHFEPVCLEEVIESAARTMAYPLSRHGFRLRVEGEAGLPPLPADRDALEQAVLNLLSNAMKYSGEARDIELRLLEEKGTAVIRVADHGIGISAPDQKKIFDKFYRVPAVEKERRTGTGLGLALAAHIVKTHKGRIEVDSAPGRGSAFSIILPMEKKP